MAKTPGTHEDDDTSQQPRQEKAPTKPERSAIDKEDHTKRREHLSDKIDPKLAPGKGHTGSAKREH